MTTTPHPLLVAKMSRLALQILATATPRTTVTSAAAELVMEQVSLASPKLRRELLDAHLAALDFLLSDCFKAQVPTATFSTETAPRDPAGVGNPPPALDDRIEGETRVSPSIVADPEPTAYRDRVQAVLAVAKKIMPEALAYAFTWGYLAGEADTNPQPESAEFANMANPFDFTE